MGDDEGNADIDDEEERPSFEGQMVLSAPDHGPNGEWKERNTLERARIWIRRLFR